MKYNNKTMSTIQKEAYGKKTAQRNLYVLKTITKNR